MLKLSTKRSELKELMEHQYDTVKRHSEKVRRIAVFLGESFVKKGIDVDVDLLEKAAIYHDLFKPIDFSEDEFWTKVKETYGEVHEEAAFIFFQDEPKLAKMIRAHGYDHILQGFETWEEKILYYADNRVMWDKIVDLKERLDDLHKRYSHLNKSKEDEELINKVDSMIYEFEKEIFKIIDKDPSVLNELNGEDDE